MPFERVSRCWCQTDECVGQHALPADEFCAKPSRQEVAVILGVHPNTVGSWAARGWLDTVVFNGEERYEAASVEQLRQTIHG